MTELMIVHFTDTHKQYILALSSSEAKKTVQSSFMAFLLLFSFPFFLAQLFSVLKHKPEKHIF